MAYYYYGYYNRPMLQVNGTFPSVVALGAGSVGECLSYNPSADHFVTLNVPEKIAKKKLKQIACGSNFTALLTTDGFVYTAGQWTMGQLGRRLGRDQRFKDLRAVDFSKPVFITQIAAGDTQLVMLDHSGIVWFCGKSSHLMTNIFQPIHFRIPDNIAQIRCSEQCTFFISKQGSVYAVGRNDNGIIPGQATIVTEPVKLDISKFDGEIVDIQCGRAHALFLTANQTVYLTGKEDDVTITRSMPFKIPIAGVTKIACTWTSSYLFTSDGTVYTSESGDYAPLSQDWWRDKHIIEVTGFYGATVYICKDGTLVLKKQSSVNEVQHEDFRYLEYKKIKSSGSRSHLFIYAVNDKEQLINRIRDTLKYALDRYFSDISIVVSN